MLLIILPTARDCVVYVLVVYMCACVSACLQIRACVCVCMRECVYVCMRARVCTLYVGVEMSVCLAYFGAVGGHSSIT